MITLEKIKEFEAYHGYYDGFYIQKASTKTNLTTDDEWQLMNNLLQDIKLANKKLVTTEYLERLEQRLKQHFDNQESISYFQRLADQKW